MDGQIQNNITFYLNLNNSYLSAALYVNQSHNVSTISCTVLGFVMFNSHMSNFSVSFIPLNIVIYPTKLIHIFFNISVDNSLGSLNLKSQTIIDNNVIIFFKQNS